MVNDSAKGDKHAMTVANAQAFPDFIPKEFIQRSRNLSMPRRRFRWRGYPDRDQRR
jgi:hypothetical protein